MSIMEKKYPVLKCNEELWNEIKPVLESFDITDFSNLGEGDENDFLFKKYPYLASNYGNYYIDRFLIGNIDKPHVDEFNTLRYLVDTKEEFLSAIAKLLGKEYPLIFDGIDDYVDIPPTVVANKQKIDNTPEPIAEWDFSKAKGNIIPNSVIKYPCIKCTQQLYDRIKDILQIIGYKEDNMGSLNSLEYLVVNYLGELGLLSNISFDSITSYNRYLCSNIRDFLTAACKLKDFEVYYIDNTEDNNSENHYFGYCINKKDKTISIHENFEEGGLQAIVVEKSEKFKKKKERYVVSHDPAVGESSTIVATIPVKSNDFDKNKGSDLDIDKNKDMEKINIANKLRHCKNGTKLYSPLFGDVLFDFIFNNNDDVIYVVSTNDNNERNQNAFNKYGQYFNNYSETECLLFPSKDNRDWNSFQVLEEGHRVMVSDNGENWALKLYISDNKTVSFNAKMTQEFVCWNYIVPVEDFDFTAEDITINKEKSIV